MVLLCVPCHNLLDRRLGQGGVRVDQGARRDTHERAWAVVRGLTDLYALLVRSGDPESLLAECAETVAVAYGCLLARSVPPESNHRRLGPDPIRNASQAARRRRREAGRAARGDRIASQHGKRSDQVGGLDRLITLLGLASGLAHDYFEGGEHEFTEALTGLADLADRLTTKVPLIASLPTHPRAHGLGAAYGRLLSMMEEWQVALLAFSSTLTPTPIEEERLRHASVELAEVGLRWTLRFLDDLSAATSQAAVHSALDAYLDGLSNAQAGTQDDAVGV